MIKIFLIAFAIMASISAMAGMESGNDQGNGGDLIVCPGNFNEVLDLYEARELRSLKFNLPKDLTYEGAIELFLSRIKKFSPKRAEMYKQWIEQFLAMLNLLMEIWKILGTLTTSPCLAAAK